MPARCRSRVRFGVLTLTVALSLPAAPQAAAETTTFQGWVSASGPSLRSHAVEVTEPGILEATLDWTGTANLNLHLFDPTGIRVAFAASRVARPERLIYATTAAGAWTIGVKAASGSATYMLSVTFTAADEAGVRAADRASDAGIAQTSNSYGTFVADVDLDGDQDFLYNRHWQSESILYQNDGLGRFAPSPPGTFPMKDRHDCVWGDIDGNGLPDMYCTVGAARGTVVKRNELWFQGEDGLALVLDAWGATDPYGRGREPALLDVNGDGLLDLFVGNYYPRADGEPTPNRLFLQDPAGSFRGAPEYGVDLEIGGQCAEAADFDGDGDPDLTVCAHGPQGGLKLYRNDGVPPMVDVARDLGVTGQWCDARWVDLDLDGRLDLTRMSRTAFQVLLQGADGRFSVVYELSMSASGCAFGGGGERIAAGDVNLDGYPDLYLVFSGYSTGAWNLPDVFLVNDGTGRAFAPAWIPQATTGSGASVVAIEADGDPQTEFLVTNGRGKILGPIQLIDFEG